MGNIEVVIYRVDGKDYKLEESTAKIERTVGMLRQYFPDVVIIYGNEEVGFDDGA